MQTKYIFLHHHEISEETVKAVAAKIDETFKCTVEIRFFKKRKTGFKTDEMLFIMADDADFPEWLRHNASSGSKVIVLPFDKNPQTCSAYAIPTDLDAALALAAEPSVYEVRRMFLCNDTPFLDTVSIGRRDWHVGTSLFAYVSAFFKGLLTLRLRPVHIQTAKEQKVDTVTLLIEAAAEPTMQRRRPDFFHAQETQCGRVAVLVYAPQSILSMLKLKLPHIGSKSTEENGTLPDGAGILKSNTIDIRAFTGPLRFTCDGKDLEADALTLKSVETQIAVLSGFSGCVPADDKESVRIQNLPKDEEAIRDLSGKKLPVIPVASETAFAELFTLLRQEALTDRRYVMLLLLSTLLAVTGLFQDSAPTVIGAMILSPLMAPIIVLAMGLIRFDRHLIVVSLKTLFFSIAAALAASALFAYFTPLTHMTAQMSSRMNPNLLDLAVAFFAGIAAAYGYAHSRIANSLAGVAIAVALVPPLSVAGIGIGWESWAMFYGAFLLFVANIAGIIAAAGITFFLMGFSSWRYAKTAFILKLIMLLTVAFPLYLSTRNFLDIQSFYTRFDKIQVLKSDTEDVTMELQGVTMQQGRLTADIIMTVPNDLNATQKQALVQTLRKNIGGQTRLNLMFRYRYE